MKTRTLKDIEQAFDEMGLIEAMKESKYCMIRVCESTFIGEEEVEIKYDNNSTIIEVENA